MTVVPCTWACPLIVSLLLMSFSCRPCPVHRCPWCQRLEPTWEAVTQELHAKYPESDGRLRFAKVLLHRTCLSVLLEQSARDQSLYCNHAMGVTLEILMLNPAGVFMGLHSLSHTSQVALACSADSQRQTSEVHDGCRWTACSSRRCAARTTSRASPASACSAAAVTTSPSTARATTRFPPIAFDNARLATHALRHALQDTGMSDSWSVPWRGQWYFCLHV